MTWPIGTLRFPSWRVGRELPGDYPTLAEGGML